MIKRLSVILYIIVELYKSEIYFINERETLFYPPTSLKKMFFFQFNISYFRFLPIFEKQLNLNKC